MVDREALRGGDPPGGGSRAGGAQEGEHATAEAWGCGVSPRPHENQGVEGGEGATEGNPWVLSSTCPPLHT